MCPASSSSRGLARAVRGLAALCLCVGLACTGATAVDGDEPLSLQALGTPVEASVGAVTAKLLPQYEYTRLEKETYVHMMLSLEGSADAAVERPKLDLALVIDRSGSMSGDKIQDVKTASLQILKELQPTDSLTLITYASQVSRHFTGLEMGKTGAFGQARQDILDLHPGGGTALGPALYDALGRSQPGGAMPPAVGSLPHVILLSDGLANAGESDPGALGRRAAKGFGDGMSVSTIGVGLDYNEDLMTRLADQGGGRYHYVRDSKEIERVLADEMAGLVQNRGFGGEPRLLHVGGSSARGSLRLRDRGLRAKAGGANRFGRSRAVARDSTALQAAFRSGASGGRIPARPATGQLPAAGEKGKPGTLQTITLNPAIHLTKDADQALKSENYAVSVRLAQIESAQSMDVVTQAIDAGDFQKAESLLERARVDAEQRKLEAKSPEVQEAYGEQVAELEVARDGIKRAKKSESERKAFSKGYKSSAYKKKKGSKKVYKKSKKPTRKGK